MVRITEFGNGHLLIQEVESEKIRELYNQAGFKYNKLLAGWIAKKEKSDLVNLINNSSRNSSKNISKNRK